ncbi:MAG TPA: AAA family ATPase [Thermoanaerobaculia bacterium]|nr:AAA family ATPase [Thermoanaerobaculia bacterium]
MLTRLKVNSFKNLVDVDVSFGPFTCIAGVNGVGKSNLFDAIAFLGALAEKPLMDAALSVRSEGGRTSDLRSIFYRTGDRHDRAMTFEAEMLIPPAGVDDLGQEAKAAITFLRYKLVLGLADSGLCIKSEDLTHITLGQARSHLSFPHSPAWRKKVVEGRRTSPFISTDVKDGTTYIKLHQDLGSEYKGGGRPRYHIAGKLPRTVLSNVNAAESATAVLARREMQSWQLLQLEPSALRSPDPYTSPRSIATNGAHIPATLARLAKLDLNPARLPGAERSLGGEAAAVYARVANRLSELIEGVRLIRVDVDDRRELLTLLLADRDGTEHEARSLSDGTLRFLALAVLESDSEVRGVLCMEEPENGIHPQRVPAMLRLLGDLAVDPSMAVGEGNPLRQVIVNTHSPAVAAQVPEDALLVAIPQSIQREGQGGTVPAFRWLPGTWRATAFPDVPTVPLGQVVSYLNPLEPFPERVRETPTPAGSKQKPPTRRVIDREDLQKWLPFGEAPVDR